MSGASGLNPVTDQAAAPLGRGIKSWMLFDWAAQPVFTVITTFIFGPYFVSRLASDPAVGQAAWGYGIAAGSLIIALLSPILGSIADQTGRRKLWIAGFGLIKIVSLIALWWAEPGSSLVWPLVAFVAASVAAEFSIVFNDSMLPRLAAGRDVGRISNLAWGLGYAGGMVVLIGMMAFFVATPSGLTMLGFTPLFGLDTTQGEDARVAGPISALWYLVFILPMFLFTPDTKTGTPPRLAVRMGLKELRATLVEVRTRPGILRFLIARMIYQDGINALVVFGGAFAAAMFGWSAIELGVFGILLNVAAIFGCVAAGRLDRSLGSKFVVVLSLSLLVIATIGVISTTPDATLFGLLQLSQGAPVLFGSGAEKAYLIYGALIGLAFGPAQASSRAYFARSIPVDDAGRYFGVYALSGRATSFLAPLMIAAVTSVTGSMAAGIATIILFLCAGMAMLLRTPYPAFTPAVSIGTRP